MRVTRIYSDRDSAVNIVTGWELKVSVIESRLGEIFRIRVTGSGAHPDFCTMVTRFLSQGEKRPSRDVE
jgi:hypothetical protein